MKQIRIDRTTIKRNRNESSTITYFPGRQSITFKCDRHHPIFDDPSKCIITEHSIPKGGKTSGCILDSICVEDFINIGATISIDNNIQTISHAPIPKYDYEYCNTVLKCYSCEKEFMLTELKRDMIWDGIGEYSSNEICPHCGTWDCVDIEYEKIDQILKTYTEDQLKKIPYND